MRFLKVSTILRAAFAYSPLAKYLLNKNHRAGWERDSDVEWYMILNAMLFPCRFDSGNGRTQHATRWYAAMFRNESSLFANHNYVFLSDTIAVRLSYSRERSSDSRCSAIARIYGLNNLWNLSMQYSMSKRDAIYLLLDFCHRFVQVFTNKQMNGKTFSHKSLCWFEFFIFHEIYCKEVTTFHLKIYIYPSRFCDIYLRSNEVLFNDMCARVWFFLPTYQPFNLNENSPIDRADLANTVLVLVVVDAVHV